MPKKTINEAIKEALKRENTPLRVKDIFKRIIEDDLYRFNAANPEHIVRSQLRRHSENLDFPTASKTKHFVFLPDGTYWIRNTPHQTVVDVKQANLEQKPVLFEEIKHLHKRYVINFKEALLNQLKTFNPYSFENFCKKLLMVYVFKNLKVTRKTKDGGIDGYGELKIGLVYMNVAFECKRYSNKSISRAQVNQFRGDIQGKFQQGIFLLLQSLQTRPKMYPFKRGQFLSY